MVKVYKSEFLGFHFVGTFDIKESGREIFAARQLGEWPAHLEAFREWRWRSAVALQRYFWATRHRCEDGRFLQSSSCWKLFLTLHFLEVLACSWHKGTVVGASFFCCCEGLLFFFFKLDPTAFWRLSGFHLHS